MIKGKLNFIISLTVLFYLPSIHAQVQFSDQKVIMSTYTYSSIDKPTSVYSADLDGDGDMDVLSASYRGSKIAWYENLMGSTDITNSTDFPEEFRLDQNYPNPFNPTTIINYELQITNDVELSIYNTLGQKMATLVSEQQRAGTYQVEWDASGFASGVYYYRLITGGGFVQSRKLLLLK